MNQGTNNTSDSAGLHHHFENCPHNQPSAELQKFGILVSIIPDISGIKSGHFQIVVANLFGIKGYNTVDL